MSYYDRKQKKQWETADNHWHTIYKRTTAKGLADNDTKTSPEKHSGVWNVRCGGHIVGYIIVAPTFVSGAGVLATLSVQKFDADAKAAGDPGLLACVMAWIKAPPGILPEEIEAKSKGLMTIGVCKMTRILTAAGFLVVAAIHPEHAKSIKVAVNAGFRIVQNADGTRVRAEGETKSKSAATSSGSAAAATLGQSKSGKIEKTYDLYIAVPRG